MTDTTTPIALFDMDATMANFELSMRIQLQKLRSRGEPSFITEDDEPVVDLWEYQRQHNHARERMRLIKRSTGFWKYLPMIRSGLDLFDAFAEAGFRTDVLTQAPKSCPSAYTEKKEWCDLYLPPDTTIHISGDKSLVYGKVLVDDWPGYVQPWLDWRPRGLVLMPSYRYNRDFEHERVIKYPVDLSQSELEDIMGKVQDFVAKYPPH